MKNTIYILFFILFIIFIYIFSSSTSGYYEYSNSKKTNITEEQMKKFEQDIAEGKNVNVNDYLKANSKDYRNNITNFGDSLSLFINKSINYILKGSYKIVEQMIK